MNKEKFLLYFKKKEKVSDTENSDFRITNVVKSVTNDITKAEITLVEDEIQKSCSRPDKYRKGIPEEIKKIFMGLHRQSKSFLRSMRNIHSIEQLLTPGKLNLRTNTFSTRLEDPLVKI